MARTLKSDKWLLGATLMLLGVSLVMVFSASARWGAERFNSQYLFLIKQSAFVVGGLMLMVIGMRVDYHHYKKPVVIWSALGITLVLLLVVFAFAPINGTRRWISLPGFTLQPAELAKLAAVFFTAAILERRMHRVNDVKFALMPIGIVVSVLAGLIVLQPDFGTSTALTGVVLAMVFSAGLSFRYLGAVIAVLVPLAGLAIWAEPYRVRRFLIFLDPESDPLGAGFQLRQSLIAVGSGGPFGRGFMDGVQKLFYIPEPHTDFIFAVISEELGLIGATAILVCFVIIAVRGLRASMFAPDRFGSLLAVGLTAMIAAQAFVNLSVVLGLLPTKGIPLPFVSNGGSSMLVSLFAMGILLNVSQYASAVDADGRVRSVARTVTTDDPLGAQA
jgi:cell division protein FtsW